MEFLKTLKKFELVKNSKIPKVKGFYLDENLKTDINPNVNYGIITGEPNNIFVVDIDIVKENTKFNDGLKELEKFKTENINIFNTLTVKTPSGGLHYYYKYSSKDKYINELIRHIKTTTHIRGATIDIRANGGYIVGPNSKINNNVYQIINDIEPIEPNDKLLYWLLENSNKKNGCNDIENNNNNEKFNISKDKLTVLLNLLPNKYKSS